MTIDNRDRFKKGPHAKEWNQITGSETFVEAANAAMLVMIAQQKPDAEASTRLEGARHFLGILSNLTTEKKDARIDDAQNLRTNV